MMSETCSDCQEYRQVARQADAYAQQAAKQIAAERTARQEAEQRADEAEEAQRIAENVAQMVAGDRDEALMDADETAFECNKLEAQLAERDQQLAALHVSVRTLGAALGACMADPHTGSCRSLWLCEQHRALLAPPAAEGGAGEG